MYTVVIADLHGMRNHLEKALDKIKDSGLEISKIVFLGDYIDRGPDSRGVVKRIQELQKEAVVVALMGNHEDMMAQAFDSYGDYDPTKSPYWLPNGGSETLNSYYNSWEDLRDDAIWMSNLLMYHEDEHRVYVHASVMDSVPLQEHTKEDLIWSRYHGEDVGYGDKHVVHGHTPKSKPELLKNRTNLDTGAVFSGKLTVGVFKDDTPGGPVELWEITGGEG